MKCLLIILFYFVLNNTSIKIRNIKLYAKIVLEESMLQHNLSFTQYQDISHTAYMVVTTKPTLN